MKILYCINSLKNPGGMERVLINKVNYFIKNYNYDVSILTTDQNNQKIFYEDINPQIKSYDLKINYDLDCDKNFFYRMIVFFRKQKIHKKRLKSFLYEKNFDIVISCGCEDTFFLPSIKDGSKKIREVHFNKEYRKIVVKAFNKNFLYQIKSYFDTWREEKLVNQYDEFIVLTKEDKELWNNKKVKVIPNALTFDSKKVSNLENKKIISVGRLDGQKGYDILIDVWKIVSKKCPDWILEIYGNGIDKENLEIQIKRNKLENSLFLKGTTNNIQNKYLENSIYIMSSRYEGFGMVLIEAMSCGLPVIAFDCKCGPKDIIKNGENGYLCKMFDIKEMSKRMIDLIINKDKRKRIGMQAKKMSLNYSEEKIMKKWEILFMELLKK